MQEKNEEKYSLRSRLKKLKILKQWRWSDVATALGMSEQMIYAVAAGRVGMSDNALFRLNKAEKDAGIDSPPTYLEAAMLKEEIHFERKPTGVEITLNKSVSAGELLIELGKLLEAGVTPGDILTRLKISLSTYPKHKKGKEQNERR